MPAAQTLFIMKSTTAPLDRLMYLESWPPISKMVSTSGIDGRGRGGLGGDLVAHHVGADEVAGEIAAGAGGGRAQDVDLLADPGAHPAQALVMASRGRPAVIRYSRARTWPSASMTTTLVLMEPTSTPR